MNALTLWDTAHFFFRRGQARWRQFDVLRAPGDVGQVMTDPQAVEVVADELLGALLRQIADPDLVS